MRIRWIAAIAVGMMLVLGYLAWRNNTQPAPQPAAEAQAPSMPNDDAAGAPPAEAPSDPGIVWEKPAGWSEEGAREMRIATYSVPGKNGVKAECAIYYFGPGQGGDPALNVERWLGEFEHAQGAEHDSTTVHGLHVTRARVRGAYRSHGMDGGPDGASASDQELMGAIVEGPQGLVFFKLTGPSGTVSAAASEFDRMIGSVHAK
jgi:hypothetical protein